MTTRLGRGLPTSTHEISGLSRSLDWNSRQAAEVEKERKRLRGERNRLHVGFLTSIAPIMRAVMAELLPLLVEIRRELDLQGDIEEFKKMLDRQALRMETMTNQVVADLQARTNNATGSK